MSTRKIKVEGFTGSSASKAHWQARLLAVFKLPTRHRVPTFYNQDEAHKAIMKVISEEFDVPAFEDLDVGWEWEVLCRTLAEHLKGIGLAKFPDARDAWYKEARAAQIAAKTGCTKPAKKAERHKGHWDRGYERGYDRGYAVGKEEGRAGALAEVMKATQRLAQEGPEDAATTAEAAAAAQLGDELDKLELPAGVDQRLFCAFGGRPGPLLAKIKNRKRATSVSSSDSHAPADNPPFPNRLAGNVFRQAQAKAQAQSESTVSAPDASPFASLSGSNSWMKEKAVKSPSAEPKKTPSLKKEKAKDTEKATTPQKKRRLSESSLEDGEVVEEKSKSKSKRARRPVWGRS